MYKNYYFDMDGVVVEYQRHAYEGNDPLFMRKNQHYFKDLNPDRKMLEVIDKMHQRSRYTGDRIYLLTSIPMSGAIFNEHFHDKIHWAHTWLPYLDIDSILISVTSKRDAVEYIQNHQLSDNDILIDDYNKNLNDWRKAGGHAIKYCNGINSPESFSGMKIYSTQSVIEILKCLDESYKPSDAAADIPV